MKKGFTLAEILGVIVIIGILGLLITPTVINRLKGNSNIVDNANKDLIFAAANDYINEHKDEYPAGKNYCIQVKTLIENGNLSEKTKSIVTDDLLNDYYISVNIYSAGNIDYKLFKEKTECEEIKSLPFISFTVSKKWENDSKKVTINYPRVGNENYPKPGSDWQYSLDNKNWTTLDEITAYDGEHNIASIDTDGGKVYAKMKYGENEIKASVKVDGIDKVLPKINIPLFPADNQNGIGNTKIAANCKDANNITIEFSDSGGSKLSHYMVKDNDSSIPNTLSTGWKSFENRSDKITIKYKALSNNTLYVYVKDSADNIYKTVNPPVSVSPNIIHTVTYSPDPLNQGSTTGTVSPTSKTVTNSNTFSSPNPNKTGYTFNGWYKETSYKNKVNNADNICLSSNITLYAKWTPNKYTVTYDANGGSVSPKSNSQTFDSNYVNLPTPTKTGYTFQGWYTEKTGGSKVTTSTKYKTAGNTTLYARWKDTTPPTCGDWTGESTKWTNKNRSIYVGCSDNGSGCKKTSYLVKTYSSGATKTEYIYVNIYDNEGNYTKCGKTANVYVDKIAPTISYSNFNGATMETLPYKGYTFYHSDRDSGVRIMQAYSITDSGCNSGWKDSGGALCTPSQNANAYSYWRAYRVDDNAGNKSNIVCSYLNNNGSYSIGGPGNTCTVGGKTFNQ